MRYSKAVLAGLMIVFLAGLGPASPQQTKYPSRYVTVLVPFTVGTAAEILARQYATKRVRLCDSGSPGTNDTLEAIPAR